MPLQPRGEVAVFESTSGGEQIIPVPSDIQEGEKLFILGHTSGSSTDAWTNLPTVLAGDGFVFESTDESLLGYKTATGNESDYTVEFSVSRQRVAGIFRVDPSEVEGSILSNSESNTTSLLFPQKSAEPGDLVLRLCSAFTDAEDDTTLQPPDEFFALFGNNAGGGNKVGCTVSYEQITESGEISALNMEAAEPVDMDIYTVLLRGDSVPASKTLRTLEDEDWETKGEELTMQEVDGNFLLLWGEIKDLKARVDDLENTE